MTKARTQAEALAAADTDSDLAAARARIGEALPSDGWLDLYLRTVTPLTDAPVEFHLAAGLSAIGAALGNRTWVESWGQNVYPHLWIVLVAPSSFWRKSTAINTAERILRDAVPTHAYPSDFSREKFLGIVSDASAGMLTLKEFGGFLAALGRDYMGGMKETLTELYDGPDLYTRSLQKTTVEIKRPAITILAATTLDWLESRITEGDLRGGFLARFLFVTARRKATAKGLTGAMDYVPRMRLVDALHDIADGPIARAEYGPGAEAELNAWMQGWEAEVTATSHRADLSGFAVRLQTYVLKLAMIYRASACAFDESQSDVVIDARSVRQAIAYCRLLWASVAALIDDDIAISKEAKELRRIVGIIGSGTTRSSALKLSKMKARDFDQYLDTLTATGQVIKTRVKAADVGLLRVRNTELDWLAVHHSNGHSPDLTGGVGFTGHVGEPEEGGDVREPEGPGPNSDTSSSSLSSISLTHDESKRVRAGEAEPVSPKPDVAAADDDEAGYL